MRKSGSLLILLVCFICFCSCQTNTTPDHSSDSMGGENTEFVDSIDSDNESLMNGAFLESLKALQYGRSESNGLPVHHRQEFSYTNTEYQENNAPTKITAVVSEMEYELTYENSVDGPLYHDAIRKYMGGSVIQWLDVSTGACVFHFSPSKTVENEEDRCTLEKQMEIARAFLNDQVSDPEEYEVTSQERTPSGVLYVSYTRTVSGLSTFDQVLVKVDQSGSIPLYRLTNVGDMRNVPPIPDEMIARVNQLLEIEAGNIYGILERQGYSCSYEKDIDRLVILDDGSLALECHIDADITAPDGTKLSDGAWFIIPITEPTQ